MTPRSVHPTVPTSDAVTTACPAARRAPRLGARPFGGLLIAAGLLLTGCSAAGEDGPSAAAAPSATSEAASPSATPGAASPTATPTAEPTEAAAPVVTMVDFDYEVPASVPAGAQVTVVNRDGEAHTFTVKGEPEVRLVVPPRGASATFTAPAQAGTYEVVCEFHGGMTTSLVVT